MVLDCDRLKNEKKNILPFLGKTLINKRNHIDNNQQNHVKIKKKERKSSCTQRKRIDKIVSTISIEEPLISETELHSNYCTISRWFDKVKD